MKRIGLRILTALTLAAVPVLALPMTADAAGASPPSPYCGITWGSLDKGADGMAPSPGGSISNVRSGAHPCYDRLVVDITGGLRGYNIRYVPQVLSEGKGDVVPTAGGARLAISVFAPAYALDGTWTYAPSDPSHLVNVTGYRTFRQVTWGGSFEGYTTIGLGVRARLPFRVFMLPGPGTGSRLVIDVAHRW